MGGFVVYNLRNHEIISVVLCVFQLLSSFMYCERAITTRWSFLFELNSGFNQLEPMNTVCYTPDRVRAPRVGPLAGK